MKILHTTPAQDGFYMPAEFAPHEGCLMIWPERADSWQYGAYAARKAFLRVIETISESESMTVLCSEGQYDNARAQLPDRVRLVVMETDDAWARDVGPTFVINGRGERRGIDWGFNAWGGDVDGLYLTLTVLLTLAVLLVNGWTDAPNAIAAAVVAISFARVAPSTRTARAPRSSPKPAC